MTDTPIAQSMVAVRATIPDTAFTAGSLGTIREGSGVVIGDDGMVLTIGYLITEAEEVWLTTHDNRVQPAHVVAYDQETGFGLVQALGDLELPALDLGRSAKAQVGDSVTVVDGTGKAISAGIVAKQEFAGYWEYLLDEAMFTAPAHRSWGGAAVVDASGELIGIGSLRLQMLHGGDTTDINMIVPIDLLKPILDEMLEHGKAVRPPRPWLGVFSAENNGQVVVMSVAEGGPAAKAGLQQGDIISDIRDQEISGLAEFYRTVWEGGPAGAEFPLRIVRNGRDSWVRIKTADRDAFLLKPPLQ